MCSSLSRSALSQPFVVNSLGKEDRDTSRRGPPFIGISARALTVASIGGLGSLVVVMFQLEVPPILA